MSVLHLHATLASLCEIHGSAAVLEALRDACDAARDHMTEIGALRRYHDAWSMASEAIGLAVSDVTSAERNGTINLADALGVVADTEVSS